MSWKLFKVNMLLYMNNPIGVVSPAQYAIKLATEYDSCMRRGGQLIGKESVMVGNLGLMTTLLSVAHAKAITKTQPGKHKFLADAGKAVEGYWTGATMMPFPIYPIPAPGSIQNLILNSGMVTNPGKWPSVPFEIPMKSCLPFLEAFVMFAKIHLFTVQGMFMTTSLYPSAPAPIPAPGLVNWQAYTIPDVPMFGISLNQSSTTETPTTSKFNPDGGITAELANNDSLLPINDKPKPLFTYSNPKQEGLDTTNTDDLLNDELRDSLKGDSVLSSKLIKILNNERKKDLTGFERFYSDAIKSIGDFKNLQPDTEKQFKKSLSELQNELQKEKDNCCVDCD